MKRERKRERGMVCCDTGGRYSVSEKVRAQQLQVRVDNLGSLL